jgi:sn-glycerol 3-phosphate transport system substrate-binding protein
MRPRSHRAAGGLAAVALLVSVTAAGCGNGKSILEIGGATVPTLPPPDSSGEPTIIPTTTAVPKAQLPPCPVDALASATGPVPITFWHAMTATNADALTQLTDAYNASQTKVSVTLVSQGSYEDLIEKYKTASAADRPTLVQMPEYTLQLLADSDTVIPVQSCINADSYPLDDFLPRAVAYYTLRSALQGMPFNISNPVLYYNKAAFVKAGLDPEKPPLSLEELRAASQALVDSQAVKYGLAIDDGIDGGGGWFLEQWLAKANELYANNENGRAAPATNVLFAGPTGVELLTFLQQMVRDGLAIDVGPNTSLPQNLLKLVDPKEPAAMTIHTTAALGPVLDILRAGGQAGITAADLGISPMPGPTVNRGVLVGGAALWLPKGKPDVETAAAWDYLKYLVAPEQQSKWAAATGYVPVRTSAVDLPPIKELYTTDPRFKVGFDQLLAAADTPVEAGPVLGPQREVRILTSQAVEAILVGQADVAQTLAQTAQQADRLIAQWTSSVGG